MKLRLILSPQHTNESSVRAVPRKHTPWMVNPVEEPRQRSESSFGTPEAQEEGKDSVVRDRLLSFGAIAHHPHEHPVFKKHREASSIELFYDLFFVANLATFTANHEISDKDCELLHAVPVLNFFHTLRECMLTLLLSAGFLYRLLHSLVVYLASNIPIRCPVQYRLGRLADIQSPQFWGHDRLCHCWAYIRYL